MKCSSTSMYLGSNYCNPRSTNSSRNPQKCPDHRVKAGKLFFDKQKAQVQAKRKTIVSGAELHFSYTRLVTDSVLRQSIRNHWSLWSGCLQSCWLYKQLLLRQSWFDPIQRAGICQRVPGFKEQHGQGGSSKTDSLAPFLND